MEIDENNIDQICGILNEAGLSNIDIFEKWVMDYYQDNTEDEAQISGFSDADCRMTVMLLAGDLIDYEYIDESYDGDYLMFDVFAIEELDDYRILRDKENLLTTMFGEVPITESGFEDAFSENWKKHGIKIDNGKCFIISILFKAYERDEAFTGHTGILLDCRDISEADYDYLFIEKIAFEEPYKVTALNNVNDLIDLFSDRPDYQVEEKDPAPAVYKNDTLLGNLSRR